MPYPNEHSARLRDPGDFKEQPDWAPKGQKFARKADGRIYNSIKVPETVDVIWGQLKNQSGDEAAPQALRFPTKDWTAEQAKKWLKDNNVKYIRFTPAGKTDDSSSGGTDSQILAEMQSHKWAMEATALKLFLEKISKFSLADIVTSIAVAVPKKTFEINNGVARIRVSGVLLKSIPGWIRLYGLDVTGYDEIILQIAEAAADAKVSAIELAVSSPGGMVAGVAEAADAIYAARQSKPVTAIVEDLAASAAYWLASQARTILAGRTAEIGSIGVYSVYYDWSSYEEKMGVKAVVIRSGEHKGMSIDKITDSQIAAVQGIIDGLAGEFIASIAKGRGLSKDKVSDLATGRLWLAEEAKNLKLIDQVVTNNTIPTQGDTIMGNANEQAQVGDVQAQLAQAAAEAGGKAAADERKRLCDLKAAFPDDLGFAVAQFEAGASLIEAKAAYADVLQKKLTVKTSAGAEPIQSGDSAAGGEGDFLAQGKKLAKDEGIPLGLAYKKLARQNPELHHAYKHSLGL